MLADIFNRPWPAIRFDAIDSTNEEARRRAVGGDCGPAWLVARRQTAGRGRMGREWTSPEGNLYATALFAAPWPLATCALACFSAGLAIIDAARATGIETSALKLKWPNDVLADDAKLAGVLIETGAAGRVTWMAAGFGVNVLHAPRREDRQTACLASLDGGNRVSAENYLPRLDSAFRARLASLERDGFEPTRAAWLKHAGHIGREIEVSPATGGIVGIMCGLSSDGALVIELPNGEFHHVRAGEISVLR